MTKPIEFRWAGYTLIKYNKTYAYNEQYAKVKFVGGRWRPTFSRAYRWYEDITVDFDTEEECKRYAETIVRLKLADTEAT